jgi:hypothetical protein
MPINSKTVYAAVTSLPPDASAWPWPCEPCDDTEPMSDHEKVLTE